MIGVTDRRVMVVGESLVDIVRQRDGVMNVHPGGSAANTAVALARLGLPTDLVSSFADDEYGLLIKKHLRSSGVRLANDPRAVTKTSTASATIKGDGSANYTFDIDWRLNLPVGPSPLVVHVSSLATVLVPGAAKVLGLLRRLRPSACVSYDINARPGITGMGRSIADLVECTVGLSDMVKASDEDLRTLYPSASVVAAARRLLTLGPKVVVVTRGEKGATWFGHRHTVDVPATPATVVDTIGAGDTFSAALIDRMWELRQFESARLCRLEALTEGTIAEALSFASVAAAVSVSRAGANPPTKVELNALAPSCAAAD